GRALRQARGDGARRRGRRRHGRRDRRAAAQEELASPSIKDLPEFSHDPPQEGAALAPWRPAHLIGRFAAAPTGCRRAAPHARLPQNRSVPPLRRRGGDRPMLARRAAICASFAVVLACSATARAADPIKVGFSMALTGAVAPNGKQNLLA